MIFRQIAELYNGTKTQTRRCQTNRDVGVCDGEPNVITAVRRNGRVLYRVGQTYAIRPGMYEPAERDLRIRILAIREERLQAISEADAQAEGVNSIAEYEALWRSINTKKGARWEDNPLVWVYEFEAFDPVELPLPEKPSRCPYCKSKDIDTGLLSDDDDYDNEQARLLGVSDSKHDPRFAFQHEHMECNDCHAFLPYGRRWYYNEATNNYDLDRPKIK